MQKIEIHRDAFSSGQVGSKIWLCETLEKLDVRVPQRIWILGGWHGISALLLLSRGKYPIEMIRSFDIDNFATDAANSLLEYWVWQSWKFRAFTADCNRLSYDDPRYGPPPDLVINTSVEHFETRDWYDLIPPGTMVALQSNDMAHEDHVRQYESLADFQENFPMKTCIYSGSLPFVYPSWQFVRYMVIGVKD